MTDKRDYNSGFDEGYAFAMKQAAELLRETSRREIETKLGDTAYPLGAVGRWFRDIASEFERKAAFGNSVPTPTAPVYSDGNT